MWLSVHTMAAASVSLCLVMLIKGVSLSQLTSTHPSLEQRLEQLAKIQAELSRPVDGPPTP